MLLFNWDFQTQKLSEQKGADMMHIFIDMF